MQAYFSDIDDAITQYIHDEIAYEITKDIEDLVFFSSYTINFNVFHKATQKLKKLLRQNVPLKAHVWQIDAHNIITRYNLPSIDTSSERYQYLLHALLKAQIQINEAVMHHFKTLCKRAHSLEYIHSRAEEIYKLLFDDGNTVCHA